MNGVVWVYNSCSWQHLKVHKLKSNHYVSLENVVYSQMDLNWCGCPPLIFILLMSMVSLSWVLTPSQSISPEFYCFKRKVLHQWSQLLILITIIEKLIYACLNHNVVLQIKLSFLCFFSHMLPMCFHIYQNNNLLKNMWYAGVSITQLNHILFYLLESNMKTYPDNKHHFFINNMFLTCCHMFFFFFS